MRIYYAHHMWKYGTEIEKYEISLIKSSFPGAEIINPATDISHEGTEDEIMQRCFEKVDSSDATVFSSISGVVGKGVYDEVHRSKAVYYIYNNAVLQFGGALCLIPDSGTKRLYATVETGYTR